MRRLCLRLVWAALFYAWPSGTPAKDSAAPLVVEDVFGRRLNRHGLLLVDWDGYMANPAIKFFLIPPRDAALPARAVLTAEEPRLYFNLPSTTGPRGPRKELVFKTAAKVAVYISIFPDRDGRDEGHILRIEFKDAKGDSNTVRLPVHVIDLDRERPVVFPITVDYSQDKTGFFRDPEKRKVVEQAASDWAGFIDDMGVRPVAVGAEKTHIWPPEGFKDGRQVTNAKGYSGYLLYAYGIRTGEVRSGGEPSADGGFQSSRGHALPIRRSGGLEVEVRGNYNRKGWLVRLDDRDWWKATNLGDVPNDLYSIVHHEIGHALFFNPANTLFARAKSKGRLRSAALRAYLGTDPKINPADHFDGMVDPASRRGVFGYEYHGDMPLGRWLITKTDLLCAQALGYKLRRTSALVPLNLLTRSLSAGKVGERYSEDLRAKGGIPLYNWQVTAGSLPAGLLLNAFTGEIGGIPTKEGSFDFTVRVRDYDERRRGLRRQFKIEVVAH